MKQNVFDLYRTVTTGSGKKAKTVSKHLRLDNSIVDAQYTLTMDGASTVQLTIHDPEWKTLREGWFDKAADGHLDPIDLRLLGDPDLEFRLTTVSVQDNSLTLTFEDRIVARLRAKKGATKAYRKRTTRAEFIRSLVYAVKQPIPFWCPDVDIKQPTQHTPPPEKQRKKGIAKHAKLTVKSVPASAEQKRVMQAVLEEAEKHNPPERALLALIGACIVEREFKNLQGNGPDSVSWGVLQNIPGKSVGINGLMTQSQALDIAYTVKSALLPPGPTSKGGLIRVARNYPDWSPGQIAAYVINGGGDPKYVPKVDGWLDEARRIISAYSGGELNSGTDVKPYAFKVPGHEDYWSAIQRLAEEVNWKAFVANGVFYYMSDIAMISQAPKWLLRRDDPAVISFSYDWSENKAIQEMSLTVILDQFSARPGDVVDVIESGPANGRWIVREIAGSLANDQANVTLYAATRPRREPPNETAAAAPGAGTQTVKGKVTGGTLRERIVAVAEASRQSCAKSGATPVRCPSNPSGQWFYCQSGTARNQDPTKPPAPGTRSDCSSWICDVYKAAGAPQPPGSSWTGWTGSMQATGRAVSLSQLKPGDLVLFGSGSAYHVELYVGPGDRTIGHGDQQVNYGSSSGGRGWTYDFLDKG